MSYRRSEDYEIHPLPRTEKDNRNYSNPDDDPRGPWRTGDVRNALYRPNLIYDIKTPSGNIISPPDNGWRWSKETLEKKINTGEIIFSNDEKRIIRKIYLEDQKGRAPETIWFGKDVGVTRKGASELKELFEGKAPFDTVKPTPLIARMMQIAGVQGNDICLDFFAGSCSTAHAVFNEEKGRFVVVQLPEHIDDSLPHGKAALEIGLKNIAEIGKERIRRTINKMKLRQAERAKQAKGKVQDSLRVDLKEGSVDLPDEMADYSDQILTVLRKVAGKLNIKNADDRKKVELNKAVFLSEEFKQLWDRIKYRTTFRVDFDSKKLIEKCADEIRKTLIVGRARFITRTATLDVDRGGVSADKVHENTSIYDARDYDLPDLVSYLQNETNLTRRSIVDIIIGSGRLQDFKNNPQKFIE